MSEVSSVCFYVKNLERKRKKKEKKKRKGERREEETEREKGEAATVAERGGDGKN